MIDDVRSNSKAVVNDISNQLAYRGKQYREATVNMKPIIESSKTYLIAVKDEIKNDPSIVFASQNVYVYLLILNYLFYVTICIKLLYM